MVGSLQKGFLLITICAQMNERRIKEKLHRSIIFLKDEIKDRLFQMRNVLETRVIRGNMKSYYNKS